jgi:hypothetical protein
LTVTDVFVVPFVLVIAIAVEPAAVPAGTITYKIPSDGIAYAALLPPTVTDVVPTKFAPISFTFFPALTLFGVAAATVGAAEADADA